MIELVNFDNAQIANGIFYGGDAGAKYAIIYNYEVWMIKYPKTTRNMLNPQISYTTSPLSEYIGSKIYESLGIPAHETLLGTRKGKIVVACKDFIAGFSLARLIPFHDLKNSFMASDFDAYSGTGSGTLLNEVLDTLYGQDDLKHIPKATERFWDMFVVDAFIGNNDRHNNNWGLLVNAELMRLAPVYDNGNAFYNKRSILQMQKRINDPVAMSEDAIAGVRSAYKYAGLDNEGQKINPFIFMKDGGNGDCKAAILRFIDRADISKITNLISAIPEAFGALSVMPQLQKDFYIKLLQIRLEHLQGLASSFNASFGIL